MQNKNIKNIRFHLMVCLMIMSFIVVGTTHARAEQGSSADSEAVTVTSPLIKGLTGSEQPINPSVDDLSDNAVTSNLDSPVATVQADDTLTPATNKVDLELKQSIASMDNIKIDDIFNVKVSASNASSQDAHNVKVLYSFSSSLKLLSSQGDGVFIDGKADHYWSIGDLSAGTSKSINLSFRVMDKAEAILTAEIYAADELDIDSGLHNGNSGEDDYSQIALNIISSPQTDTGDVLGASDQNTGINTSSGNATSGSNALPNTGLSKPLLYRLATVILLIMVLVKYYIRSSYFSSGHNRDNLDKFHPGY